jgi:hypothetical protein
MNKIYIVVEDGLVQTVYSTDPAIEVTICDLDINFTEDLDLKKEVETFIETLRATTHQIY